MCSYCLKWVKVLKYNTRRGRVPEHSEWNLWHHHDLDWTGCFRFSTLWLLDSTIVTAINKAQTETVPELTLVSEEPCEVTGDGDGRTTTQTLSIYTEPCFMSWMVGVLPQNSPLSTSQAEKTWLCRSEETHATLKTQILF